MGKKLEYFKAYDIRGKVPQDLNHNSAYTIGRAYAQIIKPTQPIAIGRDIRTTSLELSHALISGLNDAGIDTIELGLCGTEMVYFSSAMKNIGGGIMVTASHNPIEYNGMKMVKKGAIPLDCDTELPKIEELVRTSQLDNKAEKIGTNQQQNIMNEFIHKLKSFISPAPTTKQLTIVVNPGNGCAGPIIKELEPLLPVKFIYLNETPDGNFPNGIPNPLLPENRPATSAMVRKHKADLAIAWDGDCDRCFFFDENGDFIDGYYIVALLAKQMLKQFPKSKIIHDPRLTWNSIKVIKEEGGIPIECKTGHVFIKEKMRKENAVYGGEMSAHHYFQEFYFCDSGMIPWILIIQLLNKQNKPLSKLIENYKKSFPISGEINSTVKNPQETIKKIFNHYQNQASKIEKVDGLSFNFNNKWRFNLRSSQTEPVLRLNIETANDPKLLDAKTKELISLIRTEP